MLIRKRIVKQSLVPVSSMADIAFLLLIFFMLSSVSGMGKKIPITLPEAIVPHTESHASLNIYLSKEGEIFVNGEALNVEQLIIQAENRLGLNPRIYALISADRELPYERINMVLEALKEVSVYNVILVSKAKEK